MPLGAPLLGLVRPRPGFEAVAHALLGGVNLVERLAEALEVYGQGRIPCTFVTREGDVLTPGRRDPRRRRERARRAC